MRRLVQVIGFEGSPAAVDGVSWGGAAFVHDGMVENVAGIRSPASSPSTQRTLVKYVRLLPAPADFDNRFLELAAELGAVDPGDEASS